MVGKVAGRTKSDSEHIVISKGHVCCLPCVFVNRPNNPGEYHHVDRKLGHKHGFSMCIWHHKREREIKWQSHSMQKMEGTFGPSFKFKRTFVQFFGNERLLVAVNDFAIELYRKYPWDKLKMPRSIASRIRRYHIGLMANA